MTESRPMDPERLRHLRRFIEQQAENPHNSIARQLAELLADRDYQAQRADDAGRERDELLRAAANIGTEMPGMESEFGAMGSAGAVTRSAASLMVAAVRLHPKVETGIVCTVEVDGREMEVIAQWVDAPVRTNWVSMAADMVRASKRAESAEAEVDRLRSRVRVEAEDVERAGVTRAHVEAWLAARDGWKRIDDGVHPDISVWQRPAHGFVRVADGPWLVETVVALTRSERMSGLDILDEMAAASVEAPGPRTSDPDYWDDAAKSLQLTRAKCEAWLGANGWVRATSPRAKGASEWRNAAMHHTVFLHDDPGLLLAALAGITRDKSELGRILDEMARMPTETSAG